MNEISIYVACLAAYNNGILHGKWINANQSAETIEAEVKEMLAQSPEPDAEEWAIHATSGFGRGNIEEWESFETVSKLAALIEEHGELILEFKDAVDCDIDELEDKFTDSYQGAYDSVKDYACQFLEEIGDIDSIPKHLRYYFDYDTYANDLELGG